MGKIIDQSVATRTMDLHQRPGHKRCRVEPSGSTTTTPVRQSRWLWWLRACVTRPSTSSVPASTSAPKPLVPQVSVSRLSRALRQAMQPESPRKHRENRSSRGSAGSRTSRTSRNSKPPGAPQEERISLWSSLVTRVSRSSRGSAGSRVSRTSRNSEPRAPGDPQEDFRGRYFSLVVQERRHVDKTPLGATRDEWRPLRPLVYPKTFSSRPRLGLSPSAGAIMEGGRMQEDVRDWRLSH
mmetsp:Transcript_26560/g.44471  ORF Transcript_26560/g.44471 Transcript_26560/m.44471 type:complete len:239 (-) Transcript_26560:132-848(-)